MNAPTDAHVAGSEHTDERGGIDAEFADRLRSLYSYVRNLVALRQQTDPDADDPYRGLYISDAQATDIAHHLDHPEAHLERRTFAASNAANTVARRGSFRHLVTAFGLTDFEIDVFTVAASTDLDPRLERLFGYLHDDLSRRRASVGLALELTAKSLHDGDARQRIGSGVLVSSGLLTVEDPDRPMLSRSLHVSDRALAFLLGDDTLPPALRNVVFESVAIAHPQVARIEALLRSRAALIHLRDDPRGGAASVAASVLLRYGLDALSIDLGRCEGENPDEIVRSALLEARLRGAGLVVRWVDADPLPETMRYLADAHWPVFVITRYPWNPHWSNSPVVSEVVERLPANVVEALWLRHAPELDRDEVGSTVRQLRLRPEQVLASAALARAIASGEGQPLSGAHLAAAARAQNASGLERLARRVRPAVTWHDLVVPEEVGEQLRMVEARYRFRDVVLEQWRFGGKNNRRLGVVGLFAGASGVGKTMAAEALAGSLGLDLYQVNLATVVDKYIGETEKNLERIFVAAESVNCVLFFDEADALFGKRSEVSDAKDRYANVEVAYLLQRLESFEGLAILATNLRTNIDDAFTRRLDVLVDFPEPDEKEREILWERCLGTVVQRADDLDVSLLAKQFAVAGGNIRNIATSAAFLAAQRDSTISMFDVMTSTAEEYRKLGRLCTRSEFGDWLDKLQPQNN